jgi:hypothetical protein
MAGSSTGQQGTATIKLSTGKLTLQLRDGTSCFAFPVEVTETWNITGGTGSYNHRDRPHPRTLRGDIRTGAVTGTWTGDIILDWSGAPAVETHSCPPWTMCQSS